MHSVFHVIGTRRLSSWPWFTYLCKSEANELRLVLRHDGRQWRWFEQYNMCYVGINAVCEYCLLLAFSDPNKVYALIENPRSSTGNPTLPTE